jgi:hypothetical protein
LSVDHSTINAKNIDETAEETITAIGNKQTAQETIHMKSGSSMLHTGSNQKGDDVSLESKKVILGQSGIAGTNSVTVDANDLSMNKTLLNSPEGTTTVDTERTFIEDSQIKALHKVNVNADEGLSINKLKTLSKEGDVLFTAPQMDESHSDASGINVNIQADKQTSFDSTISAKEDAMRIGVSLLIDGGSDSGENVNANAKVAI